MCLIYSVFLVVKTNSDKIKAFCKKNSKALNNCRFHPSYPTGTVLLTHTPTYIRAVVLHVAQRERINDFERFLNHYEYCAFIVKSTIPFSY